MHLPDYVKKIIAALESAGHECYCVGGCVRSALLCLPASDYDVTTSALPSETAQALSDFKIIETGLKHGTVTAICDSHPVEITTYRSESGYSDHRHPDSVTFSKTLEQDLSRRDFTINAMAYSERDGIIDLFGGRRDIERRLIKTVGNADERFFEDALRILRALRFASVLEFDIEEKTASSIRKNAGLLRFVSKERIYSELCRLICGDAAEKIIKDYAEVFEFILGSQFISAASLKKTATSLSSLPKKPYIRFAALLCGTEPSCAQSILLSLKADKNTVQSVVTLVSAADISSPKSRIEIKKLLRDYGENTLRDILILSGNKAGNTEREISDIIEKGECFKLCDLEISGEDLLALGFHGKQIGAILENLLTLVVEGKLPNKKSELVSYINNKISLQ